jgi:hypothetical protein
VVRRQLRTEEDLNVEICEEALAKAVPCVSVGPQASAEVCSIQGTAPHARPIEAGCHGRQIGRKYDAQSQERSIEIWLKASARPSPAFVAERRNDCGDHASYGLAAALGPWLFGRRGPKSSQAEPHFTEGRSSLVRIGSRTAVAVAPEQATPVGA